jgi:hypothetical protein
MQNMSSTLIDHIFTNNFSHPITSGTIVGDISDHFINFIVLPLKKTTKNFTLKPSRNFTLDNINNFRNSLRNQRWHDVLTCQDVNQSFSHFWSTFTFLFDTHFPIRFSKLNRNVHKLNEFMTIGLLTSRATKIRLHKASLVNPTLENSNAYKIYRNLYNALIRKSRKMYFSHQLNLARHNPKKTWSILKEAIGQGDTRNEINDLLVDGANITDKQQIAEEFNIFFSHIGKHISNSIPPSSTDPLSFINTPVATPTLEFYPCGPSQFIDLVKSFDNKSSPDLDGISINFIKKISVEIALPLSHIFSLSLSQGIFPEHFKTARVVPIFKTGNRSLCDNYRPISLVKSFSKILEKIVQISLTNHLELNNLLYTHQYGFLRNRSTEHNLTQVINHISLALNNGNFSIGVFLDLKKAFDVCDHHILLAKLSKYGITGLALEWFKSYLSGRKQVVDISNNFSTPQNLDISVIQGSLLGPTLFLIYINDFPNCTTLLSFLFADDTTVLKSGPCLSDLIPIVNSELKKMANWFRCNKMAINTSKTKFIIFHNKGKVVNMQNLSILIDDNDNPSLIDPSKIHVLERIHNNHPDPPMRSFKLLGINLDENLTLNSHFSLLCNKLSRALFILRQSKNLLPPPALKTLYFSLFHCHLAYCPIILSVSSQSNINKVSLLQRKAIRTITSSNYNDHANPLFHQLNILPFDKVILFSKLMFMHAIKYNYCLESFSNTWQTNAQRNPALALRNADDFALPVVQREILRKSPLYSLPAAWNSLGDVKLQPNRCTFKIALQYELIESLTN